MSAIERETSEYGFNSIKVRLIQYSHLIEQSHCSMFQFHKGSINTMCFRTYEVLESWFQFHKGSINTAAAPSGFGALRCFNSIKVRLIHSFAMSIDKAYSSFNSIKVRLIQLPCCLRVQCRLSFQFHKGSINT